MQEVDGNMRVAVKITQGSTAWMQSAPSGEDMGRGVGSMWQPATVSVMRGPTGNKVVTATMDVPKDIADLPDNELIRRFVEGFNGGKNV